MARLTCCVAVILFVGTPVLAEQYWIAYEGNDFPEKEGWARRWVYKEAKRWLEEGSLVIDSRESIDIQDYYRKEMNGGLNPAPGEIFLLQWRVKVSEVIGHSDPGVIVESDDAWGAYFVLSVDTIYASGGKKANFAPGRFHDFELRSSDMRTYELSIDEVPALAGVFYRIVSSSRVEWGDMVAGAASLHRWDHVRFGAVVPEPSARMMWTPLLALRVKRWLRGPAKR